MPQAAVVAPAPHRLVILDRDGVINHESPSFIRSTDDWIPIAGSIKAIADLTSAGFVVYVATNQSGVGRGLYTAATLNLIHEQMELVVGRAGGRIAGIFTCPHHPDDGCDCRKPKPGLLRQIEAATGASLLAVPAIGDSARDLEAALAVGARPILVRTGNGTKTELDWRGQPKIEIFDNLAAAAAALIGEVR